MTDWFDAEKHADHALEWFDRGRWAEAESELRKALSLNPNQAEWHFNLGLTLEATGRDAEALVSYEHSIELTPEHIDPILAAGMACNRLGQFANADRWFRRALKLDDRSDQAYAGLIESQYRQGQHEDAETSFYLAQQALEQPSASCLSAMAESLFQRGVYDRAGWCLREALRLEPQMPRLRGRLASVLAATGKPHRALQMYLRELQDDPGNIDTLHDYGELLLDLGRLPEAAEKYRRILELEPANVAAHHQLGRIAMDGDNFEQGHLEFELVYKLDSRFPHIRLTLAEALLKRGRQEQARQLLLEQLDLLKAAQEDEGASEKQSDDSKSSDIDSVELASLLLEAALPKPAVRLFEKAIEQYGENPGLLRKLALTKFQTGDRAGGVSISRRVIRIDPECLTSIHNLALAALEEDRLMTAAGWVRRGLKIERHDDGLRRLRAQLWMALATAFFRRLWRGLRNRSP